MSIELKQAAEQALKELGEARKIVRASSSRQLAKDWDRRATDALANLREAIQQAEVTDGIRPEDFTVDVVVKPMGGFAQINTKGVRVTHKPTGISVTCDAARSQHMNRHQAIETLSAILALRPERVPMTDEQISLEAHNADDRDWNDLRFRSSWHEGFLEGARFAETHHGITAQEGTNGEIN